MTLEWKNTDPRSEVNGHQSIVILRPSLGWAEACLGAVSVENGYVYTDWYESGKGIVITPDEPWPQHWYWILPWEGIKQWEQ